MNETNSSQHEEQLRVTKEREMMGKLRAIKPE